MRERKVMKLASRGKRLGAFCIDMIIPVFTSIFFWIAFLIAIATYMPLDSGFDYGYGYGYGYPGYGYDYGYGNRISGGTAATMIISALIFIAYTVVQMVLYNKSKTIGKAALGLQVVSIRDGEPIGFWKMLFREWFVKQASGAVFLLGFIWVLIDDKNRGWHDKILDTYVVDVKETEAMNAAGREQFRRPAPKSAPLYRQPAPDPEQVFTPADEPDTAVEAVGDTAKVSSAAVENIIEAAGTVAASAQETISSGTETGQGEETSGEISRAVSEFVSGGAGRGTIEETGQTENEKE